MNFADIDFMNFKVVVQGIQTVTNAEIRVGPSRVSFNAISAAEMGYPEFVRIYVSEDASKVIIEPCSKEKSHVIPFYQEQRSEKTGEILKNAPIHIMDAGLAKGIREKMRWGKGTYHCSAIRFDERPRTLFFDLAKADNTKRKRIKTGNVLDSYPSISTLMEGMRPIALLGAHDTGNRGSHVAGRSQSTETIIEVDYHEPAPKKA